MKMGMKSWRKRETRKKMATNRTPPFPRFKRTRAATKTTKKKKQKKTEEITASIAAVLPEGATCPSPSVDMNLQPPPPPQLLLPQSFFQVDALRLAPRLLGKFLRRDDVILRITEVHGQTPILSYFFCTLPPQKFLIFWFRWRLTCRTIQHATVDLDLLRGQPLW